MPHVSGGRFQTMGIDCFFQLVRPDNPLVQLPREIAFRNDNDWELRLFGECDYSEDYSNMDLDEGEIIAPLVQVEINIIPLLREDGHHDLEVNFPDDYFDEE